MESRLWRIKRRKKKRLPRIVRKPQKGITSDPGGIRTHDPQLRRLLLYPAELRDLVYATLTAGPTGS